MPCIKSFQRENLSTSTNPNQTKLCDQNCNSNGCHVKLNFIISSLSVPINMHKSCFFMCLYNMNSFNYNLWIGDKFCFNIYFASLQAQKKRVMVYSWHPATNSKVRQITSPAAKNLTVNRGYFGQILTSNDRHKKLSSLGQLFSSTCLGWTNRGEVPLWNSF